MADQETNLSSNPKVTDDLPFDDHPELIFGLVGPIGVDLEIVTDELKEALRAVGYDSEVLRITNLMREVKVSLPLDATGYWPAPGSEDTLLRCLMEQEADHGEASEVHTRV